MDYIDLDATCTSEVELVLVTASRSHPWLTIVAISPLAAQLDFAKLAIKINRLVVLTLDPL